MVWSEKRGRTKKESFAQCFYFCEEWEGRKNSAEYTGGRKAGEINGKPQRGSAAKIGRVNYYMVSVSK